MRAIKKLTLRSERLAEITNEDLATMAGAGPVTDWCPTEPVNACLASQSPRVCVNTLRCTPYITPPTI